MFSRSKYWEEKSTNTGSKRPKAFKPNRFQPDNRKSRRDDEFHQPRIRNDKTHRDGRTAERGRQIGGLQHAA